MDMYREWKKIGFPEEYCIWIWKQQDQEVDQETWLGEVREDRRMVGGEEWQEQVYDREEWKRLLRTARNHRILYMPMDCFKYLLSTMISQLTGSCSKNSIVSNFSGDVSIPKYNAELYIWIIDQMDEENLEDLWCDHPMRPKQVFQRLTRDRWLWWIISTTDWKWINVYHLYLWQ